MKQLKITIAGKVETFDLPENGEYKCEVKESYVPKKGDCVMVKPTDLSILYWCKLTDTTATLSYFKILVNSRLETSKNGFFEKINENLIYAKITPEELKAKYAEAGYDWDYKTDTIKPLKWMPKNGDEVWWLNSFFELQKLSSIKTINIFNQCLKKAFYSKQKQTAKNFPTIVGRFLTKK